MSKIKLTTRAPLPFLGQKRGMIKQFESVLTSKDFSGYTIVDAFGGSGLLAHNAKLLWPNARVIWNDYDNYARRLASIEHTNKLLDELAWLQSGRKGRKLSTNEAERLRAQLAAAEARDGWVDYLTLSARFLFSGRYAHDLASFGKTGLYARSGDGRYSAAGYLEGVERVSCDAAELFRQYEGQQKVLWLLDPPYLATHTEGYVGSYWELGDFLALADECTKMSEFVFFSSEKSGARQFFRWFDRYAAGAFSSLRLLRGLVAKIAGRSASPRDDYMFIKLAGCELGESALGGGSALGAGATFVQVKEFTRRNVTLCILRLSLI